MEQVQVTEEYNESKNKFKEANADKSERHLKKVQLKNLWIGWCTVTNLMKFHRTKDENCRENLGLIQAKKLLIRWRDRKEATKRNRAQV
jgi:hypothetical protein